MTHMDTSGAQIQGRFEARHAAAAHHHLQPVQQRIRAWDKSVVGSCIRRSLRCLCAPMLMQIVRQTIFRSRELICEMLNPVGWA